MFKSSTKRELPTVETLLHKVGSSGRYQVLMFVLFMVEWVVAGFILLGQNFFFLTSPFQCPGLNAEECEAYVCAKGESEWMHYLKDKNVSSIVYLVEPPLMCDRSYWISTMQSMAYLGSFLGFFVFPYLGDNYGRRPALICSWIVCLVGCLLVVLGTGDIPTVMLGLFLQGFGINPGITLHFSFLTEMVGGRAREMMCSALQIAFAAGSVLISCIFYLSKNVRTNLFFFLLVPLLIVTLLNVLVDESPKFTIKRNKQQTCDILNRIARVNGREGVTLDEVSQICVVEQLTNSKSLLDLFRFNSLRLNTIITSVVFLGVQVVYYGVIFILNDLGLSIYQNQIYVGISQMLGYGSVQLLIHCLPRRRYAIFAMFSSTLLSAALIVLSRLKPPDCDSCPESYYELGVLFLLRYILCSYWSVLYIYISELFPTKVRSLALGMASQLGTIGSTFSPFFSELSLPSAYFTGFSLLSGILCLFMTETKGVPIEDQIEEEREVKKTIFRSKLSNFNQSKRLLSEFRPIEDHDLSPEALKPQATPQTN